MTKAELIESVSNNIGLSKRQTGDIINQIFDSVGTAIANEGRFSYPGFGTFTVRERAARSNPNKGKPGEKATERAEERAEKLKAQEEAAAAAAAAPAEEAPAEETTEA